MYDQYSNQVQYCNICKLKGIQTVRKGNQRWDPHYDSYDSRVSCEGSVW